MNILFRSDDLSALAEVLWGAIRLFEQNGYRVERTSLAEATPPPPEVDVLVVLDVSEESVDMLRALLDAEPVVVAAVSDPIPPRIVELATRDDVRSWQLTPRNRDRMPAQLVAHVRAMIVHGDDWWEAEDDDEAIATIVDAHLERYGELRPPWVERPDAPRFGVGWEQERGRRYLLALSRWVHRQPHDARLSYIKRHAPVPVSWVDWAASVLFAFEDQRDTDEAVKLVEREGLATFDAWRRWMSGKGQP